MITDSPFQISTLADGLGYTIIPREPDLFDGIAPQALADLGVPENGDNIARRVRLFAGPGSSLPAAVLSQVKSGARADHVPFLAFISAPSTVEVCSALGESTGWIDYIPPAPSFTASRRPVVSIREAQPLLSIADLRRLTGTITDIVFSNHGHDRLKLFDTLLLILAAKLHDESVQPDSLHIGNLLRKPRQKIASQLEQLAHAAFEHYGIGKYALALDLGDDSARSILLQLSDYSFTTTLALDGHAEILGTFYQETVSSTFRGSLGAYFTPKPVADLASALCQPVATDTIFDISCGSGTFLLSAYRHAGSSAGSRPTLFGCDIQQRMVLTSLLNCAFHAVDQAAIIRGDGLRINLDEWNSLDAAVPTTGFSLIVGNPPFAGFEAREAGRAPSSTGQRGAGARVHKIIPFIEKVVNLLADGGRSILVVPTSVLNGEAESFRTLRRYLAENVTVRAVIGVPRDAFIHTDCGVESALILFEKRSNTADDYTFYYHLRHAGYDKQGRHETNASIIEEVLAKWHSTSRSRDYWISTNGLYALDRWDVPWLAAGARGILSFSPHTHIRLTDICQIADRRLNRKTLEPDAVYRYFEVGDAHIDFGDVQTVRTASGRDILRKGRLRLKVRNGDVLLPNHRDSLIAKTAVGVGRSAVRVTKALDEIITTDRFTALKSHVDADLLMAILNSGLVRNQLAVHARGSASFDIREKVLHDVWIPRYLVEDPALLTRVRDLTQRRRSLVAELEAVSTTLQNMLDDHSANGNG